ncbi:histidinol-phosphate transaminase [Paraburkholderia caballeronis]|uniref:Histidinol-phosphate aminotransferase n=1 Tax=Paraburkholderia caballeronis TaxID=416943 RepID=A0A1H7UR14_9BURK|nr:histidinol-phosphate transaminase [Paraburkholderia caballeronis]PXW26639.1 histidinol-phosphate aminotransferase [Paraburkholderia caballeronis]PXX02185.1 histidinol-phosphate aminotransferase [Paraburkholderia caballeronis]RAK01342.1 histidinol-phosphate aminotransferase [Paraburkholderia caballeronis]TDV25906.1 histidinol-phosphate aminotransferase [Paraburkholderia caballeronis]SEB84138.1 histidinol-phosphate aminotransferase [Paraburkholderia caballeronis]
MTTQFGPTYVRAIAPYIAGKPISEVARQFGLDEARIVKLASNENPLGMPESAQRAIAQAASDLGRYPDSNGFELKAALAARYDVPPEWITLGNGSNDILEIAAHAFVEKGQSIVYSQYSFAVYALATQGLGGRAIVTPAVKHGHDLDAMLAAIADDTRLVFVANPNNPTGTFIDGATLEAFIAKVPRDVVVVLDEAYTEYLAADKRYDSIAWARRYPNLLVSRTFSKAYGLAGLRVGFAIAQPALTDLMNRLRQPFNVNSLAQAAAIAALGDSAFLEKSAALNAEGYRVLTGAFDRLGLEYVPSDGNFVLVRVGSDDDAGNRVNLELLKQGVIVRPVGNYGLPQWLRVTIGLPEENAAFVAALERTLAPA